MVIGECGVKPAEEKNLYSLVGIETLDDTDVLPHFCDLSRLKWLLSSLQPEGTDSTGIEFLVLSGTLCENRLYFHIEGVTLNHKLVTGVRDCEGKKRGKLQHCIRTGETKVHYQILVVTFRCVKGHLPL